MLKDHELNKILNFMIFLNLVIFAMAILGVRKKLEKFLREN